MSLEKLYSLACQEGYLSPEECDVIDKQLALLEPSSIPEEQVANVADYLVIRLIMDAALPEVVRALDSLLSKLQSRAH